MNNLVGGGLNVASRGPDGGWLTERVLVHDGALLSQISAAARWGRTVAMGSPFNRGVLVCDL